MQDRQPETTYHPRELLSLLGVERVLCVAPHPDDEVLGCGGLLAAWAEAGVQVHTLILTCGQQGAGLAAAGPDAELPARRRQESIAAATVLGTAEPRFLGFEDRALRYDQALVAALSEAISQHDAQVLLLPSLSEPHPDHQATALAGVAAAIGARPGLHTVLFYECGAPLHANVHFPIDALAERKWRALHCFKSQLGLEDYEPHARAMASLRAFGLRPPCQQAESFFRVDLAAVREKGALAALPQWPWIRESLQLANDPAQLPLVSVLVRSMNRACLPEALASVALQTYPNLELVVVNASGQAHRPLDFLPPGLAWRIVPAPAALVSARSSSPASSTAIDVSPPVPLGRAAAANLALTQARGDFALFLDDDDLLQPEHLERLVAALQEHPQAVGAYAGVRVETHDGVHLRDYDLPWSRQRLLGINYLPIHAVLFSMRRVRQQGLRFDEDLPVLEDWHFWRQLTHDAELVHCPGVSAVYRQGLGQSALGDAQHPHHWRLWHGRLLAQWVQGAPADLLADTLAWHAVELDRAQADADARVSRLEKAAADAALQLQTLQGTFDEARVQAQRSESARQALQQELEAFSREAQVALQAKETALQLQAAESARLLAEREAQAQRYAAEQAQALEQKEMALQLQAAESARLLAEREAQAQRYAAEQAQVLEQKEMALQLQAAESARLLAEREAQAQRFAAEAQRELDALQMKLHVLAAEQAQALQQKEAALQLQAAETARLLAEREAQAQRFAAEAQSELDALQRQLHALAADQNQALQAKEAELQRFAQHTGQLLNAKEAELQQVALQAQQALQLRDAEHAAHVQRLQQDIVQLRAERDRLESELTRHVADLGAIHASRSWRWTAPLRRGQLLAASAAPSGSDRS